MNWKGLGVLITGGAGFIGSALADRLLGEGARVRILDNFVTGDRSNISSPDIEVIEGDVRDSETVDAAMKNMDVVFHQAAQLNPARAVVDPMYDFEVNVRGGLNVLFAAVRLRPWKVVLASTNVYARGRMDVMKESVPTLFLKETLLSPYAAAKVAVEAYAKVVNDEFKIPTVRLRYSNVIGPRQRTKTESGVIALFTEWLYEGKPLRIYGDGSQKRDFVYVGDVVQANLLAAACDQAGGEVFNVGVGEETSILDMAEKLMKCTRRRSDIEFLPERAADYPGAKIDLSWTRKVLGYRPSVSTDEALEHYVRWYQQFHGIAEGTR